VEADKLRISLSTLRDITRTVFHISIDRHGNPRLVLSQAGLRNLIFHHAADGASGSTELSFEQAIEAAYIHQGMHHGLSP